MRKFKIGDEVYIEGEFIYGQDFAIWKGRLPNVKFKIVDIIGDYKYKLEADGYGCKDNYGNGHIYVTCDKYENQFRKVNDMGEYRTVKLEIVFRDFWKNDERQFETLPDFVNSFLDTFDISQFGDTELISIKAEHVTE